MSREYEVISGKRDWERKGNRHKNVCRCRGRHDESYRHCGCRDCRRRRHRERF